jgi:hypothetical protein
MLIEQNTHEVLTATVSSPRRFSASRLAKQQRQHAGPFDHLHHPAQVSRTHYLRQSYGPKPSASSGQRCLNIRCSPSLSPALPRLFRLPEYPNAKWPGVVVWSEIYNVTLSLLLSFPEADPPVPYYQPGHRPRSTFRQLHRITGELPLTLGVSLRFSDPIAGLHRRLSRRLP